MMKVNLHLRRERSSNKAQSEIPWEIIQTIMDYKYSQKTNGSYHNLYNDTISQ